jgi:hypothetical protein
MKNYKLQFLITGIILILTHNVYAINKYYKKMALEDQKKLEETCELFNSEEAKVAVFEYAAKFSQGLEQLQKKYPELEFTNPCAD